MSESYHESILLEEILESASAVSPRLIADGTLGDGGHSLAFLRHFPETRLIACDRDATMLGRATARLAEAGVADRAQFVHCNFRELAARLQAENQHPDFILLDLGVAMFHFRGAQRGFSYTDDAPLDMRLGDPGQDRPGAAELLNSASMSELQQIFQEYGEERFAGRIARRIVESRPITTARELAQLIQSAVPAPPPPRRSSYKKEKGAGGRKPGPGGIHPATRVFQALRIAVNDELGAARAALAADGLPDCLAPGGRLAVISFHSLEDRLVKNAFRELGVPAHQRRAQEAEYRILSRKPIVPGDAEIARNPASRSAKLRVLERSAENNRKL